MTPNAAILSLSGGLDSTTVLGWLLRNGYKRVHCVTFHYGSKHNVYEEKAAADVYAHYAAAYPSRLTHRVVDLSSAFEGFKSNLLLSGGEIPEGHYEAESMKQTVVPGRNIIFLSILAGVAWSEEAEHIALGIHQGDHAIYPDCRAEFFKAIDLAVYLGTDRNVSILAPFVNQTKADIVEWGIGYDVPYHLTRTCYKNQPISCGKCGSCVERKEAFDKVHWLDPIPYEGEV